MNIMYNTFLYCILPMEKATMTGIGSVASLKLIFIQIHIELEWQDWRN